MRSPILAYARTVYLGSGGGLRSGRFLVRAWVFRAVMRPYLLALEALLPVSVSLSLRRNLAEKVLKPFSRRGLGVAARADAVLAHLRLLQRFLTPEAWLQVLSGEVWTLARLEGERGGAYALTLARNGSYGKEGELVLSCQDLKRDCPLATLSLVLEQTAAGQARLFVRPVH